MADDRGRGAGRVAFRVSPELVRRAEAALAAVREDPARRAHVDELVEVILELTDNGLDYFFVEPLRRARVGAMARSTAGLGIATAGRGIPVLVRRVLSSLDEAQLLSIADFIDEILIRESAGPDSADG